MKALQFKTTIAAPRSKVWDTMLNLKTYEQWTTPFSQGSTYEGSWDTGARIRFLGPNGEGMVSEIADNRLHEYVSIRHLGTIKDGVEDTDSEEVRKWAPSYENYTLRDVPGGTEVQVDMDSWDEWAEFMNNAWPKALDKVKELSEKG